MKHIDRTCTDAILIHVYHKPATGAVVELDANKSYYLNDFYVKVGRCSSFEILYHAVYV